MRVRAILFMRCGDSAPFIKSDEVTFNRGVRIEKL